MESAIFTDLTRSKLTSQLWAGNTARPGPPLNGGKVSGLERGVWRRWKEPVHGRCITITSAGLGDDCFLSGFFPVLLISLSARSLSPRWTPKTGHRGVHRPGVAADPAAMATAASASTGRQRL